MPLPRIDDPRRFLPLVEADEAHADIFQGLRAEGDDEPDVNAAGSRRRRRISNNSVAGLRRRRRMVSNDFESPVKAVSLVEEDGVLRWCDGVPGPDLHSLRKAGRRAGRGAAPSAPAKPGSLVMLKEFTVLAPNKVMEGIGRIDERLNPAIAKITLCSRLRPLIRDAGGNFLLDKNRDVSGPFIGRTLVFVHGTFSNADNMLGEFAATERGQLFLNAAMGGERKYDNVVFFEHATLAVSPVINALELGRCFADSSGQIDVIAHSRGGLIVRWWLEAFGNSLRLDADKPVRAVLVGSPLHGTSLAAPDKLQHAMSLVSNIGSFAAKTMTFVGGGNPFVWVAGKLVEVIVSVTGALANTPLIDGLVALIPGLSGQSAVSNNYELNRLRLGPSAVSPLYYVVKSNFQTPDPTWKFWENFRMRVGDVAADAVFPGDNDLVVDTGSMTELGEATFPLKIQAVQDFGTSEVWHCNYFRQTRTIDFITTQFS
jgi:pimeloyl-ACP methyl ester carboxylesterase